MQEFPMDTLRIDGLMVDCVVGVYPHERGAPQPLRVDVDLLYDMSSAATESLGHTVDYGALSARINRPGRIRTSNRLIRSQMPSSVWPRAGIRRTGGI